VTAEYSVEVCKKLEEQFHAAQLHRPIRLRRYEPGTELDFNVTGVSQANSARVHLVVEKFVGGGFAGQVYKVKVLAIEPPFLLSQESKGAIDGLKVGHVYAMKILIPPSRFSRLFRNLLYWIGFQGPFALQVNPAAVRAGALWQKFIRRAAKIRFGDENTVVDIHATFIDSTLGSCGELSEWIDGRTWRLEVDDHLDMLRRWRRVRKKSKIPAKSRLGSPEYRAKYEFMHEFVELLHDMGGYEFARQYEWSTCKSQPNCLKRRGLASAPVAEAAPATGAGANSSTGLVAVDFRAGLALLPFLPMSPGDFKLIAAGFMRGSLVQFDRGSISKLQTFVETDSDEFADMPRMLEELKESERIYRNSAPDIIHNHIRFLYSRQLWSTMLVSAITGWKVRNFIDQQHEQKLQSSRLLTLLFAIIGLIPLLGKFILKIWGQPYWRKHYTELLTSRGYLLRAVRARIAEIVSVWHRAGRVNEQQALKISDEIWRFFCHLPISILPAKLHRFLTDKNFRKEKLVYIFIRPIRLYFNAELRQQWLREMITDGRKKHILSDKDAKIILSRISEPFIQKYLKSLAVHVCTLPVTQVVSVLVAIIYILMHPEMPRAQAWGIGLGIIALFQVVPISPGSLTRGLYVLYLVISERNFKDYNIAVFLGFFKYVGYLAFPIQMTYRYPALARFMAVHWSTEAVHIVPVFGERGALLEHGIFRLFYNWPLTIRRRMRRRAEIRAFIKPRYWHVCLCALAAAAIFGLADFVFISNVEKLPSLKNIWLLVVAVPLVCGGIVTLGCGGAALGRRIIAVSVCAVLTGVLYTAVSAILSHNSGIIAPQGVLRTYNIMTSCMWRVFIFTILSITGAVVTELLLPDPDVV